MNRCWVEAFSMEVTLPAPREQFEGYGSCSGKQVKRLDPFEIGHVLDDVEYVLAREIGCGPRGYVCRDVEAPTSVFASDYSHIGRIISGKGA